ncbi:Glutamine--fructose-6-phosphate aminotransferase [isomerizing] 1-like, partial [Homarus americanus]
VYCPLPPSGIGIDSTTEGVTLVKQTGKVKCLRDKIEAQKDTLDFDRELNIHIGIAHTRWATHGVPSDINSHPQRSDELNEFVVVHNDTEIIAKLIKHLHTLHPSYSFRELVEQVIQQLEGAFALAFKSKHFPGELVTTRRGSPLLVGIKTKEKLSSDHIPILYSKDSPEKVELQGS